MKKLSNKQIVRNILRTVRAQTGAAMIFTERALVKALNEAGKRNNRRIKTKATKRRKSA